MNPPRTVSVFRKLCILTRFIAFPREIQDQLIEAPEFDRAP
jgi:hypothetical protein